MPLFQVIKCWSKTLLCEMLIVYVQVFISHRIIFEHVISLSVAGFIKSSIMSLCGQVFRGKKVLTVALNIRNSSL